MELRQLEYFVAVVDEGGFARAAETLHIVQSAISQQVKRLERELGLILFDRRPRQVELTGAGAAFLPHARSVLAAVTAARGAAADLAAGERRTLRVGTSEGLGRHLEGILAVLAERHPEARVDLSAANTGDKLDAVRRGDLDAAFVRAPRDTDGLSVLPLWDADLVVALPASHPAAAESVVPLAVLADLPAALAPAGTAAGVARLIADACVRAGFRPLTGPPFTNLQDLLAGPVAGGRCWTLVYADVAAHTPARRVAFRRPDPAITVPTTLVTRSAPAGLVQALRSAAAEYRP
ncbi:LysR family transcriptional regulator [Amycolatopsis australiensis]|uniref:DNA-binding transcriptional regulator, LysR family n=1 Tax=Amycolatopsis australiensis TaxID=546364 RepID=A0A1K1S357_9PSEU|nr:LysR substrate-binding domain-containing protein [Amycolatopsis australiensis]SFW78803.1 DNA-binding transcriptional regulator, LysR family [Amycolatopsis australiensis]